MRVPNSGPSVRASVRPVKGNGQVHFAVPIGFTFIKFAPTVQLYLIYWYHMMV